MQESYQNALIETLSDIDLYGLYIFLPCILALIFTVMHKKDRRKKLWKMLLVAVPLVIIYKIILIDSIFDNTWFEVFVIFAIFYAISIFVGIFFSKKKFIIAISVPLILCSSYLSYATYKFYGRIEPFGRIGDYTLPKHIKSNDDYAIKITYINAVGDNIYSMTIRGKNAKDSLAQDSISYCMQHGKKQKVKDQTMTPPKGCQWKNLTDDKRPSFFKFKQLAESYQAEFDCEQTCNNYDFNVDIIDYNKRTFRTLELGHASMHVNAAQEIVDLGLKLIMSSRDSIDIGSSRSNE